MNQFKANSTWSGKYTERLFQPVSVASLAVFRIGFGLVMIWHLVKLIWPQNGQTKLAFQYVEPAWNCPFVGFEWIRPLPEPLLTITVWLIIVAAFLLTVGLMYRVAAIVFFFGYTYLFLLESADYNNHYYLICLFALLLACMPANKGWSVDSWIMNGRKAASPSPTEIPFWPVFLLRFQLFVVYFFGGIAKINSDWLTGLPLFSPATKIHHAFFAEGIFGSLVSVQTIALFLAWGGLVFDLAIGFLLLSRFTRAIGIIGLLFFHLTNNFLFTIGIFPIMAFVSTLIFLPPDWPIQFRAWLRRPNLSIAKLFGLGSRPDSVSRPVMAGKHRVALVFLACWMVFQIVFPLRHFWISDDANWTEEGQRFAWRMMLRMKAPGHIVYYVNDDQVVVKRNGRDEIEWGQWPSEQSKEIFVPVICEYFSWQEHKGLTLLFEPCLGRRLFFAIDKNIDQSKQIVSKKWLDTFGRTPNALQKTISLRQAVNELKTVANGNENSETKLFDELECLASRQDNINSPVESSRWQLSLSDVIERLMNKDSAYRKVLVKLHPFALQGVHDPNCDLLVINDPIVNDENQELLKLANGKSFLIWLDLEQLRPRDWRRMPQQFVVFDRGNLKIVWNHFRELNWQQTARLANRPHMIWQYAQHIGRTWRAKTGRQPEVRASTQVILNYRNPQPIVDPDCDLIQVEYQLLGHNDWITKLKHELPSWERFRQRKEVANARIENRVLR